MQIGIKETDAQLIAAPGKIPIADATGKIDTSWLVVSGIIAGFVQSTQPSDPASTVIAIWNDTSANQIKIWTGAGWAVIA